MSDSVRAAVLRFRGHVALAVYERARWTGKSVVRRNRKPNTCVGGPSPVPRGSCLLSVDGHARHEADGSRLPGHTAAEMYGVVCEKEKSRIPE